MITDIDYNKLIRLLLPVRLRVATLIAWVSALIAPIRNTLYPRFKGFERDAWYKLKHQTGQVAYLEKVLNDAFDPAQTRIYISPGMEVDSFVYIYKAAESLDLYLYTNPEARDLYLLTDQEQAAGSQNNYDFTINVPVVLPYEEVSIEALANRYKRDGKYYNIQYF